MKSVVEDNKIFKIYASMTPEERLRKGIELTELMKGFNTKYMVELNRRMKDNFVLSYGTK